MSEQVIQKDKWYTLSTAQVVKELNTDPRRGLSDDEALKRRAEHGTNELPTEAGSSVWELIRTQFTEVMVLVLLAAAVVSVIVGDTKDAVVIMAIVILNAGLGFFQE